MIGLKSVVIWTALSVALLAVPNSAQAQAQIYVNPYDVNPYGSAPYSGYYGSYSGYSTPQVPHSYYNDGRHHFGPHSKLHWTRQEGLHWGRHYGRHHIGGHDLRYPVWY